MCGSVRGSAVLCGSVCTWCGAWCGARCALAIGRVLGLVQGRVQGLVVAGHFWCSYAWVSLTQTPPVRPRGCLCACVPVCARLCACVQACAHVPIGGCTRCVLGVYSVWVVWRLVWVCGGVGSGSYLFSLGGAGGSYLFHHTFFFPSLSLGGVRWWCAVVCAVGVYLFL